MLATFDDLRHRGGRRLQRLRRAWRRRVLAHRRALAVVLAAAAVLVGLQGMRPAPPPSEVVLVAARDLPSGTVLRPGDVIDASFAEGTAPDAIERRPLGRTLAAPVRRGEAITDLRLVSPALARASPGLVPYPVRIPDADVVALLRVGDRVDVLATDPESATADVLLTGAPVLALPTTASREGTDGLAGRLVVLGVPSPDLTEVGSAAVSQFLTVALSG